MIKWIVPCAIAVMAATLGADTIYLRDGRTFSGTFISGNSREIRFLPERGRAQTFAVTTVDRISFAESHPASSDARGSRSPLTPSTRDSEGRYQPAEANRSRSADNVIPAGTVVTVSMIDPIDSDESSAGQTYRASLDEPLVVDGRTIAPRGADALVQVVRVQQSGAITGHEEIALVLSEIDANGRKLFPQTQHAEVAAKSRGTESAKVIGGTAVVGAIIGAIAGGGKGAAIGAASGAGAGAAVQAIRGQKIQVPSESKLDFTLAEPLRY